MNTISRRRIGTIIFLAGIFMGLALAVAVSWSDYEAMSYFYTGAGYPAFRGLKCPILISHTEVAPVSATFDNPDAGEINPYYKVEVSGVSAARTLEGQVAVPAHEAKTIQWTVDANDIDLNNFVMIKLQVLRVAGYSTREATCGVLVVDFMDLSGQQLLNSTLVTSLLGMLVGLGLREGASGVSSGKELSARNALRAVGVVTALAMLAGLMGSWLIGVLLCAMTVLLLVILLRYAFS